MAFTKVTTDGIADNAVSTAKIGANAVDTTKIGADVIVADDIADNAITVAQISDGAVAAAKLADGAVTHAKLHSTTLNPITLDTSNNRVGINSTSPSVSLEIGATQTREEIKVTSTGGGAQAVLGAYTGTESYVGSANNVPLYFRTNGTNSVYVDTSGRLLTPNQPSFMVYGAWSYDSNYIWKGFATVDHNIGSHWNNATGRFTAPIAGRYMIYATNHHNSSGNYHLWVFLKNGSLGGGNWVQSYNAGAGYHTTSKQQVWNLAAGDYLEVASNASYPNGYQAGYTAVGAYLVG